MTYKTLHTKLGLQLLAQAEATGSQIRLTHFAVGDGAGYPVIPSADMIGLVRERFRATVNRVFQDPENDNKFTAEIIIPVSVGGFVMREIGVFDSNGNLVIVGNIPDTQKPVASDGSYTDTVYRIPFMVSNADTVQLNIDPNVVIATHSWILNTLTPAYLFPGGTTGQVLKKSSNEDGETEWADPADANVFVDCLEEEQQLAADQTIVTFSHVTTTGLAIYIDGERISNKTGADGWQATSATDILLGKSYPAGSVILGVQNDPLGSAPYPLAQSENLADLINKTLARTNLGVFSKEESRAYGLQPGAIIYFAMNKAPSGYLKANGAAVSRTAYAELFAEIGTLYGAGDGVTTFNLPDGRAEFIRGLDDGRGIDAGRAIGSRQSQQLQKHKHLMPGENMSQEWIFGQSTSKNKMGYYQQGFDNDNPFFYTNDGTYFDDATPNAVGVVGEETRPRNLALLCCIKY